MKKADADRRLARLEQGRRCRVCGRADAAGAGPTKEPVSEVLLIWRTREPEPAPPPACPGCGRRPWYTLVVERVVPAREPETDPDPELPTAAG